MDLPLGLCEGVCVCVHNILCMMMLIVTTLRIIFTGELPLMRKIRKGYQDDEESKKTLDTPRLGKKLEHFRLE